MVTKTLGTTAQRSSTAPSLILTRMARETSVMMTMTMTASRTCCHLVLITAVLSPTHCRRTQMVGDTFSFPKRTEKEKVSSSKQLNNFFFVYSSPQVMALAMCVRRILTTTQSSTPSMFVQKMQKSPSLTSGSTRLLF